MNGSKFSCTLSPPGKNIIGLKLVERVQFNWVAIVETDQDPGLIEVEWVQFNEVMLVENNLSSFNNACSQLRLTFNYRFF